MGTRSAALLALVVVALPGAVAAQQAAPTPAAPAPAAPAPAQPQAIAPSDIAAGAEEAATMLASLRGIARDDGQSAAIERELPSIAEAVAEHTAEELGDATVPTPRELLDRTRSWRRLTDRLASISKVLAARIRRVDEALERAAELGETWRLTAEAATAEALPVAVADEIATIREAIDAVTARLRAERDRVLTAASRTATLQTQTATRLEAADTALTGAEESPFIPDAPPLWQALARPGATRSAEEVWRRTSTRGLAFFREHPGRLAGYLVWLAGAVGLMLVARRGVRRWMADDATAPALAPIVEHPVSSGVLIAVMTSVFALRRDPLAVSEISAFLLLVPLTRLTRSSLPGRFRTLVPLLGVLLVVWFGRGFMFVHALEARVLLIAEAALVGLWIAWAVGSLGRDRHAALLRAGARVGLVMVAASIVANVVGSVALAVVLIEGLVAATFVGLAFHAVVRVSEAAIVAGLGTPVARRVRSVEHNAPALQLRLVRLVRVAGVALWALVTLHLLHFDERVVRVLRDALGARLEIGELSVSAADLVAFALTVYVALLLARVVRSVLEDDVLARMELPRGVPAAISAAANYLVLLVGFFFALSAAGLDLSRVTLLAGALGVGIGFGLQNVVNNFVSGLILLFERPVRVGDVIEIEGAAGWVRRIGIRSSTVEAFEGAEVIVPNADLISGRLTNWTFSNMRRRIDVQIGVAYGTDPRQVLEILDRAARELPGILRVPPPLALFLGFGESSLDFVVRGWTYYDDSLSMRSRLALAVHDAIVAAGIDIPFPQRDVRLRSVDRAAP